MLFLDKFARILFPTWWPYDLAPCARVTFSPVHLTGGDSIKRPSDHMLITSI